MIKRLLACALWLMPQAAMAQVSDELAFLERNGCVVGPQTENLAIDAGVAPGAIAALLDTLSPDEVQTQGEWQVLAESVCTIGMPQIDAVLQHDDPDVKAAWSTPTEFEGEFGAVGCFFRLDRFTEASAQERGWSEAQAFNAYIEYVAAGIVSGEIRFFSDNPLETPMGPRLMVGDCAVGGDVDQINANHAVLVAGFGPYVRAAAPHMRCGRDRWTVWLTPQPDVQAMTGMANTNGQLSFEMFLIMFGAGWVDRDASDATDRGTLLPPTCVYARNGE